MVFDLIPETNQIIELLDGEIIVSDPHDKHQKVSLLITLLLGNYILTKQMGELRYAPTDVVLDGRNIVQPDLCIEILSPNNMSKEYWIVNPDSQTISVWVLENGDYILHGHYDRQEELHSPILGGQFALKVMLAAK